MDTTRSLPSGTVTFLFTDIEGSTRLWEQHPEAMRLALARHDALLRAAIESHDGHVFKTVGDAFCAAFDTVPDALAAAVNAQLALQVEEWNTVGPLRVRMALHSGAVEHRAGDYFGPPLNRVARLLAAAHGGQILLSQAAWDAVREAPPAGTDVRDLGPHRLKDLQQPEQVFQLLHPDLPADFPPLRSLEAFAHNLPLQVTSFVGREQEMAEARRLLGRAHTGGGSRLLTLTGVGGTGKTRLALQVAADLLGEYADGVWLVELAPLSDPALMPQTVASALGVREEAGRPLTLTLVEALKPRKLLVLLDNCEHLLTACAQLADALLRACPGVQVLATSREGLNIPGETTYRLPSLSVPDPREWSRVKGQGSMGTGRSAGHQPSTLDPRPSTLLQYEAVRLFLDRATTVAPAFTLTEANAPAVGQICHRLDGIPLAIEMAAARVKVLSVEKIAQLLDDRFRLLTGGSRTALPRQQTLRALIDWSYDLLSEPERRLLCRLAVFAGGWTLEAASAVCSDPVGSWQLAVGSGTDGPVGLPTANCQLPTDAVLDLLTALAEKSLVLYEEQGERYRLLETVRQYARDRLLESGEGEAVRRRHHDFFLTLAEEERSRLGGPEQIQALDRLEREHDNLRAALDWCTAEAEGAQAGLRLAGAVAGFWTTRGYLTEGRERLAAALSREGASEGTAARAGALGSAGNLAFYQGDFAAAEALAEERLRLWRELGDTRGIAGSLFSLGISAGARGDRESARSLYEESLALYRQIGDNRREGWILAALGFLAVADHDLALARSYAEESLRLHRQKGFPQGIARSLSCLACVARDEGDTAQARQLYQESLALSEQLGNKIFVAERLFDLGKIAADQGDPSSAHSCFRQSLIHFQEIGNKGGIADALVAIVRLTLSDGGVPQPGGAERAAHLLGVLKRLRDAHGHTWGPVPRPEQQEEYDRLVQEARSILGEASFVAAWEEGRAMTLDQALALALEAGAPVRTSASEANMHAGNRSEATRGGGGTDTPP